VVLDAGHGGDDPGASYYGMREKLLTLDIARRVRPYLRQVGLSVVMTRETDSFVPLSHRAGIANRLGADLFVSIHVNANTDRAVSGAEVYFPRVSVVASNAQWPPSVVSSEIGVPSMTVKQVLWDLVLSQTRVSSAQLAEALCEALGPELEVSCQVKAARFVVLREAWMPSVLVEVGYVSNRQESQRLHDVDYREASARAIAAGIVQYIRATGVEHL
jgi:N-acetylmuramoyl-L-alanine amidase